MCLLIKKKKKIKLKKQPKAYHFSESWLLLQISFSVLIYSYDVTGSWIHSQPLDKVTKRCSAKTHVFQYTVYYAVSLYLWLLSLRNACRLIIFRKSPDTTAFKFAKLTHAILRHSLKIIIFFDSDFFTGRRICPC